jgi:Mor family transcriptional regulator
VWCTRKENIAEYNRAVGPNGKQWGGTRKKKFSDAVKTALREDYKKGMSKVSLAKKYHMSIITVYRFLGFPWAKTLHGEK